MSEVRLIDANALEQNFDPDTWQGEMMIALVRNAPTIDPVKHGRWIDNGRGPHCSECEVYLSVSQSIVYQNSFCPNCGARMDGEGGLHG